jgi:antitoxin component of MazEF toxin-antitoxin module
VDVREEGGIITPVRPTACDLDDLLAGITPENLQAAVDLGPAVGQEGF